MYSSVIMMIPLAIIVFREVLEIALIIGAILTATAELPRRHIAIYSGFFLGTTISIIMALSIHHISASFNGLGQEYFLATILLTASFMMAGTVLWMQNHTHQLKEKIMSATMAGHTPILMLSLIITLTILREGFELVLFSYGLIHSVALSWVDILSGSLLGLISGSLLGYIWYLGIITFTGRHVFKITSILLLFMAAGMASQAIHQLISADLFEHLTTPLWDSSWLLSDQTIAAKIIKSIFGYQARPSGAEVLAYVTFLMVMLVMFFHQRKTSI